MAGQDTKRTALKIVMIALLIIAVVLAVKLWGQRGEAPTEGFEELAAQNPEVIAWLTVDGTAIDTPVCQATNNTKYLNTDVHGEQTLTGCPFLDYRSSPDFTDCYQIIYGHNVENHLMFSDLKMFTDEEFWSEDRTGTLKMRDGKELKIEFFACVIAGESESRYFDPRMVKNNWTLEGEPNEEFLDSLTEDALIAKDSVKADDRVLTLSTCEEADSEDRILVMGRIR